MNRYSGLSRLYNIKALKFHNPFIFLTGQLIFRGMGDIIKELLNLNRPCFRRTLKGIFFSHILENNNSLIHDSIKDKQKHRSVKKVYQKHILKKLKM